MEDALTEQVSFDEKGMITDLDLWNLQISKMPSSLQGLPKFEILDLSNNEIKLILTNNSSVLLI
ncbi:MAG: hypothetical protein ACXAEU_24845, partial [Candidatus Hodarchaeales archaeon]